MTATAYLISSYIPVTLHHGTGSPHPLRAVGSFDSIPARQRLGLA